LIIIIFTSFNRGAKMYEVCSSQENLWIWYFSRLWRNMVFSRASGWKLENCKWLSDSWIWILFFLRVSCYIGFDVFDTVKEVTEKITIYMCTKNNFEVYEKTLVRSQTIHIIYLCIKYYCVRLVCSAYCLNLDWRERNHTKMKGSFLNVLCWARNLQVRNKPHSTFA